MPRVGLFFHSFGHLGEAEVSLNGKPINAFLWPYAYTLGWLLRLTVLTVFYDQFYTTLAKLVYSCLVQFLWLLHGMIANSFHCAEMSIGLLNASSCKLSENSSNFPNSRRRFFPFPTMHSRTATFSQWRAAPLNLGCRALLLE
jgi:hypothetical protein